MTSRAEHVAGWLSSKRITAVIVLIVAVHDGSWGAFTGIVLFLALLGLFAGRLLRMGTVLRWAVRRTFGSLGLLFPLLTRPLPLLLAVTFLFINAEVWQVAALMSREVMWLSVLFFGAIATVFLLARLPEEVRRVEDEVRPGQPGPGPAAQPGDPVAAAQPGPCSRSSWSSGR